MLVPVSKEINGGILAASLIGVLVSLGIVVLMWRTGAPPAARLLMAGIALFEIAIFAVPAFMLSYRMTEDALIVQTALGKKTILRSQIASASIDQFHLRLRVFGTGTIAYNVGRFRVDPHGELQVFTGRSRGTGVVLKLQNGERVLLSPADPGGLVRSLHVAQ